MQPQEQSSVIHLAAFRREWHGGVPIWRGASEAPERACGQRDRRLQCKGGWLLLRRHSAVLKSQAFWMGLIYNGSRSIVFGERDRKIILEATTVKSGGDCEVYGKRFHAATAACTRQVLNLLQAI
jgi:hypothetical protein